MNIPELTEAVWFSNIEEARRILPNLQATDLQERDKNGNSLLHTAVKANAQPELFQLLLPYVSLAYRNNKRQLAEDLFEEYKFGPLYREELDNFIAQKICKGELIDLEEWVLQGWTLPNFDEEIYQNIVKEKYLSAVFIKNLADALRRLQLKVSYVHYRILCVPYPELSVNDFKFLVALDSTGFSAIHKAVILEKVDLVATLLGLKSDLINCLDYLGNLPVNHANCVGNQILQSMFIDQGSDYQPYQRTEADKKTVMDNKDLVTKSLQNPLYPEDEPDVSDIHHMFLRPGNSKGSSSSQFMNAEARYVFEAVGNPLVLAISELVQRQPVDPIDYLAHRLLEYRAAMDAAEVKDAEFEQLKIERKMRQEELVRQKAMMEELERQKLLEEERIKAELEKKRLTVPVSVLDTRNTIIRDKEGSSELHKAVKSGCTVSTFLDLVHKGQNFVARDGQGRTVRDLANEAKNEAIVKEIDSIIINWVKEDNVEAMESLFMNAYSGNLPNMKKAFGSKLKGMPESIRKMIDDIPKHESHLREFWKLCANGTPDKLDAMLQKMSEKDIFSRNRDSLTCLQIAILSKNLGTTKLLINKQPALVSLPDNFNRVALHYAFGSGTDYVKALKSSGVQDTVKDCLGYYPKIYAQKYDLLPDAPNYGSPELVVTEEHDDVPEVKSSSAEPAASTEQVADPNQDLSKLTPITEDDNEA